MFDEIKNNFTSKIRWTTNNLYINDELLSPIIEYSLAKKASDIYLTSWESLKIKSWEIKSIPFIKYKDWKEINTKFDSNSIDNILKNIFSNQSDMDDYIQVMNNVWEYDYWIWFQYKWIDIRLRLNFAKNIKWTTIVIRPLLSNILDYKELTSLDWTYDNSWDFLDEESRNELIKMNNVWYFLMWDFLKSKWLIIVTWKTWSWKSTLTTSFLNELIKKYRKTIVTIEDPIEYIFDKKREYDNEIIQIEVPTHVKNFATAIKGSKRQNPDVVYIAEIRDRESALALLDLLSAWHLVVTTLHTWSIVETFDRLVNLVWNENEKLLMNVLADQLLCIVNQKLLRLPIKHENSVKIVEKWIQEYLHVDGYIKKAIRWDETWKRDIPAINWKLIDSPPHTSITKLLWLLLKTWQINVNVFLENVTDINLLPSIIGNWLESNNKISFEAIKNNINWSISDEDIISILTASWIKK